MSTPQLRLVRDPRAVAWEAFAELGIPNSLGLSWLDHPNDGEPGFLMPGILWAGLAALDLTDVLFATEPSDSPESLFRRQALVSGEQAFLASFDVDGSDSWQPSQCFMAMRSARLPSAADTDALLWFGYPMNESTTGTPPFPTSVPKEVPLLWKVGVHPWRCVAFAESAETRDRFAGAIAEAATAAGVHVTHPEERSLFSDEVWARYGPRPRG